MKTLIIKSLLSSLYQREVCIPSLAKRGKGRFFNNDALLMHSLVIKPHDSHSGPDPESSDFKKSARTPCGLATGMNYFQVCVIARLDRAIQRKELDPPVKPEDDGIEFDFYALRSWRRVLNKATSLDTGLHRYDR